MTTKKHNLTSGKDHITGKGASDLFVGSKFELGSNDVLNGGAGIDTISAELTGKHLAPVMKNIEKGIFTHQGKSAVGLDLADAQQMTSVTLKNFDANAIIRNASNVQSIALNNIDYNDVKLSGLDATKFPMEKISFSNATEISLALQTKGGLQLHKIDISLDNSYVRLNGDLSVVELAIHSNSKGENVLNYYADGTFESVQKVTLDGSASLDFNISQTSAFRSMTSFDASAMDGALSTQLESDKLALVRGGSDNDLFAIYKMGGTQAQKADLNMGAGADEIYINESIFDGSRMVLNGGKGVDTVHYNGIDKGMAAGFTKFEALEIENISGTYDLGASWKSLRLYGSSEYADGVVFKGGTNLSLIQGSTESECIQVDDIGGKAGHKAQIKLETGDDMLKVVNLDLDAATQRFDGGDGHDGIAISGALADVGAIFKHFEYAYMYNMQGSYDFSGSGINGVIFGTAPVGAMSLNGMESGSAVQIGVSQTTILSVNIENAASSQSESLTLQVYSDANIGSSTFGLITPDLSNLTIEGTQSAHTVYLSQVGSMSDLATLTVTGDAKMTLIASNASTSYIDEIVVTNTAGLDMYGLLDGSKALVSSGVDITGGSGADILVGGAGGDTISSGGGDNIIHGSLGVDDIDIGAGALDMLIFHSRDQSAFFSGDNVTGFNIFDGIDISEIVSSVSFGGNFAAFNDGLASLSTNHSVGFFDTTNDTLYVDINHDGALTVAQDMEFHLNGLDTFNSTSLIG